MSGKDPFDMLVKDHHAIDHTFKKLLGTEDPLKRTEYASQLIRMLAIHSMTEEVDVYPYYPNLLDHGSDEKQHVLREHLQLDNIMRDLEKMEPTDPKWAETVEFAYKKYNHHIREEEDEQFPQLRAKLTVKQLEEMASKMELSRRLVPTHPHPDVPEALRESKVAGSLIGLMDRMRDLFTNASKNELNL